MSEPEMAWRAVREPGPGVIAAGDSTPADLTLRSATEHDAAALHALVTAHVAEGHLLPRQLDEIRRHADRFVVCVRGKQITACAELAPLSATAAEIRSLVVAGQFRRAGIAARLVDRLRTRAKASGFEALCAFTHDPRFFARQGFSMVPHAWMPAKIVADCLACPLFRRCGQHAMALPLDEVARFTAADASQRVAVA